MPKFDCPPEELEVALLLVVGIADGRNDGVCVRAIVGCGEVLVTDDGDAVGVIEGESVLTTTAEGLTEGSTLGSILGDILGDVLGDMLSSALGSTLGDKLGSMLGIADGE